MSTFSILRKIFYVIPNGSEDENVFDIEQGVSISFLVRKNNRDNSLAKVFYADLFGTRESKYQQLQKFKFGDFSEVEPLEPFYSFVTDGNTSQEYTNWFSPTDVFMIDNCGYQSGRDGIFIAPTPDELKEKIKKVFGADIDDNVIKELAYQPFDNRYALIVSNQSFIDNRVKLPDSYRPRNNIMKHFCSENVALLIGRQGLAIGNVEWNLAYYTDKMPDINIFYRGGEKVFPLYLYSMKFERLVKEANLRVSFRDDFFNKTGIKIAITENEEGEDISYLSDYIYAILNSRAYRQKFQEQLKLDFPRIPYPESDVFFNKLSELGAKMRLIQLGKVDVHSSLVFVGSQSDYHIVERCSYKNGKIYLNKEEFFDNVNEDVWSFYVGGYQPMIKWLKDHKNSNLTETDILYYKKMYGVIEASIGIMNDIDENLLL